MNHLTTRWHAVDLEKGIKHTSLAGSGWGGRLRRCWDASVASSPLLTPGSVFSAVPHGGNAAVHSLPFHFGARERRSALTIELLLDFCGAGAVPGARLPEHPLAPLQCSSEPGTSSTLCLRAKRSPREALNIHLRVSLAPLIMAPQFLQIRTLYLIK